jgi:hypothetical protein
MPAGLRHRLLAVEKLHRLNCTVTAQSCPVKTVSTEWDLGTQRKGRISLWGLLAPGGR